MSNKKETTETKPTILGHQQDRSFAFEDCKVFNTPMGTVVISKYQTDQVGEKKFSSTSANGVNNIKDASNITGSIK